MSMKKCKECGAEVSSSAKVCPQCGKKLKHAGVRIVIGIIVAVVGICLLAGDTTKTTSTPQISNEQNQAKATMDKFNQIKTGMTYKEVVKIVGEEGSLSTESSYGDQSMQIYYWYASNGISNMTISFMNGIVNAKSQIGLE